MPAIEEEIEVSRPGNLQLSNAGNGPASLDQFLGGRARCLAKTLCELKANRSSELTHFDLGCLVQHDVRRIDVPLGRDCGAETVLNARVNIQQHKLVMLSNDGLPC